jgi:hypothetical protein
MQGAVLKRHGLFIFDLLESFITLLSHSERWTDQPLFNAAIFQRNNNETNNSSMLSRVP